MEAPSQSLYAPRPDENSLPETCWGIWPSCGTFFSSSLHCSIYRIVHGEGKLGSWPSYGSSSRVLTISRNCRTLRDGGIPEPSAFAGTQALAHALQHPLSSSIRSRIFQREDMFRHSALAGTQPFALAGQLVLKFCSVHCTRCGTVLSKGMLGPSALTPNLHRKT